MDEMKKYFEDGKTPRLELSMLPRDVNRSTGDLRKVLCSSFNYCRRYGVKLELYISILRFVLNYALMYVHFMEEKKEAAEEEQRKKLAEEIKLKEKEVNNE